MRHRAAPGEEVDVVVVDPDRMGERPAAVEDAERLELGDHRAAVALFGQGSLDAGFQQMGVDAEIARSGDFVAADQHLVGTADRVGRAGHDRDQPLMAVPGIGGLDADRCDLVGRQRRQRVVAEIAGDREVDAVDPGGVDVVIGAVEQAERDRRPHADPGIGAREGADILDGAVLLRVVVDRRGDARAQHVERAERRADRDLLGAAPRRVGLVGPHEADMVHPVGRAAQQVERRMGVRVDQPGGGQPVPALDGFGGGSGLARRGDPGDQAFADQDVAFMRAKRAVFRQQRAAAPDHGLGGQAGHFRGCAGRS